MNRVLKIASFIVFGIIFILSFYKLFSIGWKPVSSYLVWSVIGGISLVICLLSYSSIVKSKALKSKLSNK